LRGTGICIEFGMEKIDFCLCYGMANLQSNKSNIEIIADTKFHKDYSLLNDGEIRQTYWYERRLSHTSRQNIELEKVATRPSPFEVGYRDWISNFQSAEL